MSDFQDHYKILTAKAPVNIALIKYWGKSDEDLKIPINDSLSGTLSIDHMCATTSVALSSKFKEDEFWLNGQKQDLSTSKSPVKILLEAVRNLSKLEQRILQAKVHLVSYNNFPTAAGLASSAAGYACLAYVLGNVYGITDLTKLSVLARRGSGSACRSLFGGFVRWHKGDNDDSSRAAQIVDHSHWPEMRVIICVINDHRKETSSSAGMARSVETSSLIAYRAESVVPRRINAIIEAIERKDFESFSNITMQDSNQFHAICLDTFPPIFYLSDASRHVIKICSIINSFYGKNRVAYTFDAGPNACIYLLDDFVPIFIALMQHFFPVISDVAQQELQLKGLRNGHMNQRELDLVKTELESKSVKKMPNSVSYLISTSIGSGPKLVEEHLTDPILESTSS